MHYVINQYRKDKREQYLQNRYPNIADARAAITEYILHEVQERMPEEEAHIKWHRQSYGEKEYWRVVVTFGPVFNYTDFVCYEIHSE